VATFNAQINDYIGSFSDTDAMEQFLRDGLKQLYNILPPEKLLECVTHTELNNSPSTLALNTVTIGPVLSVTRKDSKGFNQICRQVSPVMASRVTDTSDLMHAKETDPVYFVKNSVLNVYPDPTASQTAEVLYLPLTQIANGDSAVANLSNDMEYIVVLYAAIKCAESLLATEEDTELYVPMITSLKQDYVQALQMMGVQKAQAPRQAMPNTTGGGRDEG
tara:strand:+ start:27 stop:686 length:660 start_codon:yes stop_codon:yes gene_type:complete